MIQSLLVWLRRSLASVSTRKSSVSDVAADVWYRTSSPCETAEDYRKVCPIKPDLV